jgi:precorrin-6B methylase 2
MRIPVFFVLLSTAVATFSSIVHQTSTIKTFLNQQYRNADGGYVISDSDKKTIKDAGSDPTYGEITPEGVAMLISHLSITDKDVFYDLGSGLGKMVLQMYTTTPVAKAVGVELSQDRFNQSKEALEQLQTKNLINKGRILDFINKNILDVPLADATIIYISSTCFSDDFLKKITEKIATEVPASTFLRVISLRTLPAVASDRGLIHTATYTIPMTWSSKVMAYVYERKPVQK